MTLSILRSSIRRSLTSTVRSRQVFRPNAVQRSAFSSEVAPQNEEEPIEELSKESIDNLRQTFFEKSSAAERYRYFARRADGEGYAKAAACFESLARGESAHAQEVMSVIEDATGMDPTTGEEFGSTMSNLEASVVSETHDVEKTFPQLAEAAKEEKVEELTELFESIAVADKNHLTMLKDEIKYLREMTTGQTNEEEEEE